MVSGSSATLVPGVPDGWRVVLEAPPMVWRTLVRLTALALALAARPAWAETPPEPVPEERYSLSWVRGEGAEDCPPRSELANEVTKRLGRSPFEETATRSIEIQVDRDE